MFNLNLSDVQQLIVLIPMLPLAATLVTAMLGKRWLKERSHWPVLFAFAAAFLVALRLLFVVSGEADLDEIRPVLDQLRNWSPEDVLLMPEGTDAATLDARAGWIGDICKREGFRFCPRLQRLIRFHLIRMSMQRNVSSATKTRAKAKQSIRRLLLAA